MTQQHDSGAGAPSDPIDRNLTDALRTTPLTPEALARIHAAVRQEWRTLHPAPGDSGSRRKLWMALAAGLCAIALILAWIKQPPSTPLLFGSASRIDQGPSLLRSTGAPSHSLLPGDSVRTGDEITVQGLALISLREGSNLRLAAGTVIEVLGPNDVELSRGMIYVDHPPQAAALSPLRLHTRAGIIEHVGSAYEVFSSGQVVRVRVREGQIRLVGLDTLVAAGTEIVVNSGGVISRGSVALNGEPWRWVASVAPAYEIEGRPLLEFLQFESRELGYELVFADEHARQVAERTILHGNVRGREPLDAVNSVLATTSLTYSIRGNTLQVHSSNGT